MSTRDEPELIGRTSRGARMLTVNLTRAPRVVPKAGGRKPTPRGGAARPGAGGPLRDALMAAWIAVLRIHDILGVDPDPRIHAAD